MNKSDSYTPFVRIIVEVKLMNIVLIEKNKMTSPLYSFFNGISKDLCIKVFNKFKSYAEHGELYHCNSLKTLNSKIWKYNGTIYKLRIDKGKESARILFSKSKDGDLTIIHAFMKSTRKTPKKEAHQAITIYQSLETLKTEVWDKQSVPC